jgi:raffinose/stachyose/melibiose transport system substrate-binding protein
MTSLRQGHLARTAVLGVAAIVAACSGTGSSAAPSAPPAESAFAAPSAAESPSAAAEPVTLTVWGSPGWNDAEKAPLQAFQDATGIKVNVELLKGDAVLPKWNSGERPDIMFYFADAAHLAALNPAENLQELSGEPFASKQLPSIQEAMKFDGKTYAALWEYPYVFGVLYNKAILEEVGVQPPTNFDELLAACQTIKTKKPDVAPIFFGGGDMWPLQHLVISMNLDADRDGSFIDGLNNGTKKFTDPEWLTGLQDEKQLADAGCFNKDLLTATFEQQAHTLVDGTAAININNTYEVSVMLNNDGAEKVDAAVGFSGLSQTDGAAGFQGSTGIEAPKTGDPAREAAARQFINWYMLDGYPAFIAAFKDFPVMQDVEAPADIPQIYKDANAAYLKDGLPIFSQRLRADYGDFPTVLNSMVAGQSTPEEAAAAMQAALEKSAKAIGLPGY